MMNKRKESISIKISILIVLMLVSLVCFPGHSEEGVLKSESCTIYFDYNHLKISDISSFVLSEFIEGIKLRNIEGILVVGYGDVIGGEDFNYKIAKKRAELVARYIINNSTFTENDFVIVSKGGKEYITTNETAEGRATNRQVKVTAIYIEAKKKETEGEVMLNPMEP